MEMVEEPKNPTFKIPRVLPIYKRDGVSVPVKNNFSNNTIYIPVFKGLYQINHQWGNG